MLMLAADQKKKTASQNRPRLNNFMKSRHIQAPRFSSLIDKNSALLLLLLTQVCQGTVNKYPQKIKIKIT